MATINVLSLNKTDVHSLPTKILVYFQDGYTFSFYKWMTGSSGIF